MKRTFLFLICAVLLCIGIAGCGCENSSAPVPEQDETAGNISEFVVTDSSTEEVLILEVGDAELFNLDKLNIDNPEAVSWSSTNPQVAAIDDAGRVDALSAGVSDIVILSGENRITCSVKVVDKNEGELSYTTAITSNQSVLDNNIESGGTQPLYYIKVNRSSNCVTVYTYDQNGNYTVPVRAMICSCGENNGTITGEFATYFKSEWNPLFGDVYGKYVTGFSGDYLFHSVPYLQQSSDTVEIDEYNNLGESVSMGCVRLAVADTKWIYDNCDIGTQVVVYDDENPGPLGRPESMKITDVSNGWDPTDDDPENPYNSLTPVISGASDITIKKGESIDLYKNVTAVDTCNNDITDKIKIKGQVYTNKPGKYIISYIATDAMHRTDRADVTIVVEE